MKFKHWLLCASALFIAASCNKNEDFTEKNPNVEDIKNSHLIVNTEEKERLLSEFAKVLSKATYENLDLRAFIKNEAVKQFDKNYDVLYYLVKDELVKNESFKDLLISYSSKEFIEELEQKIPLLNILVPSIPMFDIAPESLDLKDHEIPVAVSKENFTTLYLGGNEELILEKGEVPNFHVFVVNENSRVEIPVSHSKTDSRSATSTQSLIAFKSPNYDGSNTKLATNARSAFVPALSVGKKAIDAFSFYNQDNGSIYQIAKQRDYIYYGIRPNDPSGALNSSVTEYIGFLEVHPDAYFLIADQRSDGER